MLNKYIHFKSLDCRDDLLKTLYPNSRNRFSNLKVNKTDQEHLIVINTLDLGLLKINLGSAISYF